MIRPQHLDPSRTLLSAQPVHSDQTAPACNATLKSRVYLMDMDFPRKQFRVRALSCKDALETLAQDVRKGMLRAPRSLPPKYFYDEAGSRLFDAICKTQHYYLTRTESVLLEQHAEEIIAAVRPQACVELGAGTSVKTESLLSRLAAGSRPVTYVPIDVCEEVLIESAGRLLHRYPRLRIEAQAGEYLAAIQDLPDLDGPVLFIFIGSSIGNFTESESIELLAGIAEIMAPGDAFLLGLDRVKDSEVLEQAYDDAEGITAQFNLNVLKVLNTRLGGNFRLENFSHRAVYQDTREQIEMYLVARQAQQVTLEGLGEVLHFQAGEAILTEISRKYTRSSIQHLLAKSSLIEHRHFVPGNEYFSLVLAKALK